MNPNRLIIVTLFLVSFVMLAFEILVTRISSVIFVNSFAFIVLSLSVLGLGFGGLFAFLKRFDATSTLPILLPGLSASLMLFAFAVTYLPHIQFPAVFFTLVVIPFFLTGFFFALTFKAYASHSFSIYAADLSGAALGAVSTLWMLPHWGPINSILLLSLVIMGMSLFFWMDRLSKMPTYMLAFPVLVGTAWIAFPGVGGIQSEIPVGDFPEKDIHHVYDNPSIRSTIIDSRWSIYGRSDLVSHSHQDVVRHLFVDGAAGSQMFRFNGDPRNPDPVLRELLPGFTSTLPIQAIQNPENRTMLVIGPGGGKEILVGLVFGMRRITGVEVNPDFVQLVKDHSSFNGGIYTRFQNVEIVIQEGRQYARVRKGAYDIITMVLPSTKQVQSIQNHAMSENFLLTTEAIGDYLNALKPDGRLIFTVYNEAELKRLIVTSMSALEIRGVSRNRIPYHFIAIEDPFSPTLVIQPRAFTSSEIRQHLDINSRIPEGYPTFTYLPYASNQLPDTRINRFLNDMEQSPGSIEKRISDDPFNISATYDDSPYFYKIHHGLPSGLFSLFIALLVMNLIAVTVPYRMARSHRQESNRSLSRALVLFSGIGLGFILMEIALFHKLSMYLGSPTLSLSILLSSLLLGMGLGSYRGNRDPSGSTNRRLFYSCGAVAVMGTVVIQLGPLILDSMNSHSLLIRGGIAFMMILPLGYLMGTPFPTGIRMLNESGSGSLIPWMYGLNGTMTVFGSISAIVISMEYGYLPAFYAGTTTYALIAIFFRLSDRRDRI